MAEKIGRVTVKFHLAGLMNDGLPIPKRGSAVEYVEAAA
jgi:predicted RNase H-like HicB family nuclease